MAKQSTRRSSSDSDDKRMADIRAQLHFTTGALHFSLEMFGDHIAAREGYKEHSGFDAIRFYLMSKHDWLPRDVNSMSVDEMRFALSEDMSGWTLPVYARRSYPHLDEKAWERGT